MILLRKATIDEAGHDKAEWVLVISVGFKKKQGPGEIEWVVAWNAKTYTEASKECLPYRESLGQEYGLTRQILLLHSPPRSKQWLGHPKKDIPDDVYLKKDFVLDEGLV